MSVFDLSGNGKSPLTSPCQLLGNSTLFGMPVWIKRDDLLHPVVSGNKFRKLKYPLLAIAKHCTETGRIPTLVTMGGIWSNHLHATAYVAAESGYKSIGLVRGNVAMNSAMLEDCRAQGMQIQFVERDTYRALRDIPHYWQNIVASGSDQFWFPEGGSDPAALHGVAELIAELPFIPDTILVACGTAATLAGLLAGLQGRSRVVGIAVLKNADYLHGEIARLLQEAGYPAHQNYQLITDFHHGGYAKVTPELRQFCHDFTEQSQVPIEPVYTGKVFYALRELIKSGYFQSDEKLVVLHTGGLQGARGMR
ncbi:1-aminocyclopropane-1-carboxylate deaminase/D-cysteine desulfhydrase [Solimicrobium silvestre]|nr:pyridoxal-phosphate dependent enzyme [Solimicrobium silvestre]